MSPADERPPRPSLNRSANGPAAAPAGSTPNAATAPGGRPTPDQVTALTRQFAAALGQITAVLIRSPVHRFTFLADLEWRVMPAIVRGQFTIAEAQDKSTGVTAPVAAVLWASVSPEVDQRLTGLVGQDMRLKPEEWASGNLPWIIEAIGDQRSVRALVKTLVEQRFSNTGLKTVAVGQDGKAAVRVVRAGSAPKAKADEAAS